MKQLFAIPMAIVLALSLFSIAQATAPQMINYQGYLVDNLGNPVADGPYSVVFTIYDAAIVGSSVWTETQSVTSTNGLFAVLLGSVNPILDTVFNGTTRYMGLAVASEPELVPRVALVSVPYAQRVSTIDGASGGAISSKVSIGPGNTNTGVNAFVVGENNTASALRAVVSGGYLNSATGAVSSVAGGEGNSANGNYSTVGGGANNSADGYISTIAGGQQNEASGSQSAVGGGHFNFARGDYSVIAGGGGPLPGDSNSASGFSSTVGGGKRNEAIAPDAVIGGGLENTASGQQSTIGGGAKNYVAGKYSAILGGKADTISSTAHYSYLFGINSSLTADSTFMVDMPHVRIGDEVSGYELPASDGSSGQVLKTDGSGQVSWSSTTGVGGSSFRRLARSTTVSSSANSSWTELTSLSIAPDSVSSYVTITSQIGGYAIAREVSPYGSAYGELRLVIDGIEQITCAPAKASAPLGGSIGANSAETFMTYTFAPTASQKATGFVVKIEGRYVTTNGAISASATHIKTDIWGI